VSAPDAPDRPLFPEALDRLVAAEAEGDRGALFLSPHPDYRHNVCLTAANTLLRWNGSGTVGSGKFAPQIRRLLDGALRERELSLTPEFAVESPYGRAYKVIVIPPYKVMIGSESSQILRRAADLDATTRAALQANARTQARLNALPPPSPERIKAIYQGLYKNYDDGWLYHYAEHVLSDEVLSSEAVREHARRNARLPMWFTESCARYLEVTRDPIAETALRELLPRLDDGLRPDARLFEVVFALHYLVRAGIDVARYLPEPVGWLRATLKPWGVGLSADEPYMDTDMTAFAIYVDQVLGWNKIARGAAVFESKWNEDAREYRHIANISFHEVFTELAILEAYLRDPATSRERQRALWEIILDHLEQRVWMHGGFISPLSLWEKIIHVLFTYEHRFPERTTRSHHRALDLVLSLQEPSGGFRSFYFYEANPEETAYALYALKTALAAPLPPARRDQVRGAALAAERFLIQRWAKKAPGDGRYQDNMILKLSCGAPNGTEALVIGALLMPWPQAGGSS
jgi:hypothetical protein